MAEYQIRKFLCNHFSLYLKMPTELLLSYILLIEIHIFNINVSAFNKMYFLNVYNIFPYINQFVYKPSVHFSLSGIFPKSKTCILVEEEKNSFNILAYHKMAKVLLIYAK